MPYSPGAEDDLFREALKPGRDCPTVEELEGAPENFVRHLEACAHCRTELEMLRSFYSNELPVGDAAAIQKITERLREKSGEIFPRTVVEPWWKRFSGAWLRPAALVAAAVLVMAGVAIQWRHYGAPSLSAVTDGGKEVFRSATIAVLSPTGDLKEAPSEVRWEAAATAARYQVRLMEVDHTELWKADTADTRAAFPPEIRARIVPLKTLLWEVSAFDSEGRKVAQSEVIRFRISQKVYSH
jgi:hypothetical protein